VVSPARAGVGHLHKVSRLPEVGTLQTERTSTDSTWVRRRRLESVQGAFEDKPVVGFVATLIKDYVPLIDEYYYCQSGAFHISFQDLPALTLCFDSSLQTRRKG